MATETLSIFDTPLLQSMTPQLKVKVLDHALSSAMQSVTLCEEALKSAQVSAGIAIDAYFLKKMQAQLEESPEEALATKAALAKLPRPLLPTPPPRIVETNLEAQLDAVSFEVSNSSLSASTEEPMDPAAQAIIQQHDNELKRAQKQQDVKELFDKSLFRCETFLVHADALLDTLRKQDVAFASSTSFSSSSAAAANASIPATVAATADPTDVVNAAVAEFDKAVIRFQHSSRDIVWECKELSAFAEILHASTMRDLTAVINARIVACEINGDLPLCLRFLNVHPSFADVLQNVVDGVHSTTQINMQTTLELAVTNNHVDVVHYLARLSNLSCPHIAMDVNDPKTTLLSTAILHRSFACIDELMRFRDFDPNAKCLDAGFNDTFAIIFAAQRNGAAAIRSLSKSPRLLANAKSHYSGSYDVLALTAAAKRGDLDSLNALLALPGIDVNAATYSPTGKQTALHIAATDGTDACIAALLKHKDINVNVCDNRMKTPLQKAIAAGNFCTVRLLVQHPRIEINKICSESGDTALHCALDAGNSRVVELILQHPEINVNVQNNSGKTAAMVAAISMPQMFKHIIHFRNCDETKKDKDGKTALEHYHNVHWSGTDKSVAGSKRRR